MKKQGFTLIELLVAIAVVGILASGLVLVVNPLEQTKKARDAQRKADLAQIQEALELYQIDNNHYPESIPFGSTWPSYIEVVPKEPLSTQPQYAYQSIEGGTGYRLYAKLERCSDSQIIDGINCDSEPYNYSVVSPNLVVRAYVVSDTPVSTPAPTATLTPTSTPTLTSTPSVFYVDNDLDTYGAGPSVSSCPAGKTCVTNNLDCYDNNAIAKPGQTLYFGVHRGDGSFDYDCSGTQDKRWTDVSAYPYMGCYSSRPSSGDFGWTNVEPDCGGQDTVSSCVAYQGLNCTGSQCGADPNCIIDPAKFTPGSLCQTMTPSSWEIRASVVRTQQCR